MLKPFLASVALAFFVHGAHHRQVTCARTYTVAMGVRAIDSAYSSGLPIARRRVQGLRSYVRCQRQPGGARFLTALLERRSTPPSMRGPAIASWYDDAGTTGCGFHARYGVATLMAPCGSRFEICNGPSCIVATRDDSGPYVGGRSFDLNPSTRAALNCAGLCSVSWRLLD